MKILLLNVAILILFGFSQGHAAAYDWEVADAQVTLVEPTYLPSAIAFVINKNAGNCTAGTPLNWTNTPENNKYVYASLLSAVLTGKKINLYGFNQGCAAKYLHLKSN